MGNQNINRKFPVSANKAPQNKYFCCEVFSVSGWLLLTCWKVAPAHITPFIDIRVIKRNPLNTNTSKDARKLAAEIVR